MKRIAVAATLAAATLAQAAPLSAGPIARACLTSERDAANNAVCGCIQAAADLTLSARDQRLAAEFFREPDRAHEVRMSKTSRDDAFWDRYEQFGATATATCS